MASLTLRQVGKTYSNHTEAVKNVSLSVEDGDFVLLTGEPGCGKSTLLKLIAGTEKVTAGQIFIGEREVQMLPAGDRGVSIVTQNLDMFPHLNVFDNLMRVVRDSDAETEDGENRVETLANELCLTEYIRKKPKQLPAQIRWRAALAKALAEQPSVLLLDEPLANLHAFEKQEACDIISRVCKERKLTAVYVTHDPLEMEFLFGKRLVMQDGRL